MSLFRAVKLIGIMLLTTGGLCWMLTTQSFLDPLTSLVLFAVGVVVISVMGMTTIDFWD